MSNFSCAFTPCSLTIVAVEQIANLFQSTPDLMLRLNTFFGPQGFRIAVGEDGVREGYAGSKCSTAGGLSTGLCGGLRTVGLVAASQNR